MVRTVRRRTATRDQVRTATVEEDMEELRGTEEPKKIIRGLTVF